MPTCCAHPLNASAGRPAVVVPVVPVVVPVVPVVVPVVPVVVPIVAGGTTGGSVVGNPPPTTGGTAGTLALGNGPAGAEPDGTCASSPNPGVALGAGAASKACGTR
ncbi:hypothetical protein [Actinoplanes sp. N902-109]|uniref:hypothetical protein n=1 Tax=Actinoplanes sp. (strain N902-109) TaxID=649831 RepID=UPI0005A2A777|nr:hypothetical protein [Actinoplanes sp. N902-109]